MAHRIISQEEENGRDTSGQNSLSIQHIRDGTTDLNTDGILWIGGSSSLPLGLSSAYYEGFVGLCRLYNRGQKSDSSNYERKEKYSVLSTFKSLATIVDVQSVVDFQLLLLIRFIQERKISKVDKTFCS
ncbi:hypothetical protein CEXT_695361 [Caerostris extrusa]|uniref:Uncharacterized protein n=1 Tax=Caerostris extrusa TaxID=172846 RepID=A0AAV4MB42_CAEEX|nr:hypothetical protein CEXT_695361 [Caerostris extrusa]